MASFIVNPHAVRWIEHNASFLDTDALQAATSIGYTYLCVTFDADSAEYGLYCFIDDPDCFDNLVNEQYTKSIDEAHAIYDSWVKESSELSVEPDWAAQARYDEAHGTINGGDPGAALYRELVGE